MTLWECVKWWFGDLFALCYWTNHKFTIVNTYKDRFCSRCGLKRTGKPKYWEIV